VEIRSEEEIMAYNALEVMEKANRIYEIEELSPGQQFACFITWVIEICLVFIFAINVL